MRSFIVTGASACGKTTLVNEAMKHGYVHLPTHTTREQRPGEIQGVHNTFLDRSCFEENFRNGIYLEPSLGYAENIGVYYGTPLTWLKYLSHDNYCATPITPLIARKICLATDVLWVALICNDDVRRERLAMRGISEAEIEARLKTSKDQYGLPSNVMIFDTTLLSPSEILTKIAGL